MDVAAYYGSAGKRPFSVLDDDVPERNGRQKRRAVPGSEDTTQSTPASGETEYRILCPGTKIGSVIGKGGSIIKSLRQECRSKIKVEDPVPGCDERVIYICSSAKEGREKSDNQSVCAAQEALFKVHARIVESESGASDEDDDEPPQSVTARLLVPNNQIGCLLGKGGRIIEQMRKEIGTQIRILPKEQLPLCATSADELVQLSGDAVLVKKALKAISTRLYENPPRERAQGGSLLSQAPAGVPPIASGPGLFSSGSYLPQGGSLLAPTSLGGPMMGLGHSSLEVGYGGTGVGNAWSLGSGVSLPPSMGAAANFSKAEGSTQDELLIRVLCPNERIGSIIGKGGNVIRKMREETGAKIKVGDPVSDSDERVLLVTSNEYMESLTSPGIEAALQVYRRLVDLQLEKDKENKSFTVRLLVPSNQIGCLLGKGGNIISEMRKMTKANIRIPPKEELPKCAGESDELVQIMGDQNVVHDALVQVLTRLRSNLFKGRDGVAVVPLSGMAYSGSTPMLSSYGARHELEGPGMYPLTNLGLHAIDYDSYGLTSGPAGFQAAAGRPTKESRRRPK